MELKTLIQAGKETQEHFLDRCYIGANTYGKETKIQVYPSKKEKEKTGSKAELWTQKEFNQYLTLLPSENDQPTTYNHPTITITKCDHKELTLIEEENLDENPQITRYSCANCGRIIHEFQFHNR